MKRIALYAVAIAVVIGGLAAAADALVLTDEERLEQLVDALDGEVDDGSLDEVLRFVATDREPLEVSSREGNDLYEDADADLAQRARGILRSLRGSEVEVVQHTIEIEGDEAEVALRARTRHGVLDAQLDLVRHGERWLVWRARVR
ncbi:MAG: hypothetical protein CMN30_18600 [Sandaracinus sp.]|nr:hypothetical protein [Sandaracinus sp.]